MTGRDTPAWAAAAGVGAGRSRASDRRRGLCAPRRSARCARPTVVASFSAVPVGADALLSMAKMDAKGLIVAVAQQWDTGEVLMVAYMNEEAIRTSLAESRAVYYSRSRGKLWRKGEQSGNVQTLREMFIDCDGDSILMKVDQIGGVACHTGRPSCFYSAAAEGEPLRIVSEPLMDPVEMYGPGAKKIN